MFENRTYLVEIRHCWIYISSFQPIEEVVLLSVVRVVDPWKLHKVACEVMRDQIYNIRSAFPQRCGG
jgi:hypothetical protein